MNWFPLENVASKAFAPALDPLLPWMRLPLLGQPFSLPMNRPSPPYWKELFRIWLLLEPTTSRNPAESFRLVRVQRSAVLSRTVLPVEAFRWTPQPVLSEPSLWSMVLAVTLYRSMPFSPFRIVLREIVALVRLRPKRPPPRFVRSPRFGPTLMFRNGGLPVCEAGSTQLPERLQSRT